MKLTFLGGAGAVTGANYLLEAESGEKTRILIDCGLMQGAHYADKDNFNPFAYDPKTIDAVFVTHAHIDHTGRLPKLYKEGYRGKIYSTGPTKDFAEELLLDSGHILAKESEDRGMPYLYEIADVNETMKLWQKISYHEKIRVKDFEIEFYDAGHILGSAFIAVTSPEGKKIVFSGDLGNEPAPLIKDTETITDADYVLIESAYGNRVHEQPDKRKDMLEDAIEDAVRSKGTLMIPAFAMERTQDLLYEINDLVNHGRIPAIPVFVDSPLAIKLTAIYEKYSADPQYMDQKALEDLKKDGELFDFPRLKLTLTTEQSKEINDIPPPKAIMAGSGMSQGGRILHHELRYLPDPHSTILFIGFQTKGSLGRMIQEGAPSVRIFGEVVPVKCKVKSISGYSAHADQPLLLNWIRPMKDSIKKLFVVQGEEEDMPIFANKIRDEFAIDAAVPKAGDVYELY